MRTACSRIPSNGKPCASSTRAVLDGRGGRSNHSNMRANVGANATRVDRGAMTATADLCNVPCFTTELVARRRASLPVDEALEDARVSFAALADRTRLKILHALIEAEELCVCDVAHVVGMSVSAASHHLRKLRDLRILKYRNDGKMAYYALGDPFIAKLVRQALRRNAP